jgi:hypothetical protein
MMKRHTPNRAHRNSFPTSSYSLRGQAISRHTIALLLNSPDWRKGMI